MRHVMLKLSVAISVAFAFMIIVPATAMAQVVPPKLEIKIPPAPAIPGATAKPKADKPKADKPKGRRTGSGKAKEKALPAAALCPTVTDSGTNEKRPMTAEECRNYVFDKWEERNKAKNDALIAKHTDSSVFGRTVLIFLLFLVLLGASIITNFVLDKKRHKSLKDIANKAVTAAEKASRDVKELKDALAAAAPPQA